MKSDWRLLTGDWVKKMTEPLVQRGALAYRRVCHASRGTPLHRSWDILSQAVHGASCSMFFAAEEAAGEIADR
jgi:hypothetical protein